MSTVCAHVSMTANVSWSSFLHDDSAPLKGLLRCLTQCLLQEHLVQCLLRCPCTELYTQLNPECELIASRCAIAIASARKLCSKQQHSLTSCNDHGRSHFQQLSGKVCLCSKNIHNNLQAFQLVVIARYLLGVPEP